MSEPKARIRQLQQIPVFALRQVLHELLDDGETETLVHQRFSAVLGRSSRNLRRAVQRLNREEITRLIDACPEVGDEQIQELFEEYRYGTNPSFYIRLFDAGTLDRGGLGDFRQRFEEGLRPFNELQEEGLPRIRRLALNDLVTLPGYPEILEGNYRFQKRLDYIDEDENAVSTYETLYGFFWLNAAVGYVIIHARKSEVLDALERAIEEGAGIRLVSLFISKTFKDKLPFLLRGALRSGRLHDPDPESDRFRWLTIADDNPYGKGYERYETAYPELRSARYREEVGEKETSLMIRCDRGALSLAGKLRASQFRAWCLDRLGQLIGVLNAFKANPPDYVRAHHLATRPEMAKFGVAQKEFVLEIISSLLMLKQSPGLGYHLLEISPLELAASMGKFVRVQIPFECPEFGCNEEGYVACPICGATTFTLSRQGEGWQLECREHRRKRWTCALPLEGRCENEHLFTLGEGNLAEMIELLPSDDLLQVAAGLVNRYLEGYDLDPEREGFMIRGSNLFYYPDRTRLPDSERDGAKTVVNVWQKIGTVRDSTITGADIGQIVGDVS